MEIVDFRHLSRHIAKMVQDGVQSCYCIANVLSIGTKIDDLELPLSEIQGH